MTMPVSMRIALREMRGGLRGFRVLLVCLVLGVAAIAGIGSVRAVIEAGLSEQGAVLLGGDAEVELTYRFADAAERDFLNRTFPEVSETAELRSMLVAGEGAAQDRALTQVKAVDDAYPLYGKVGLSPDMSLAEALRGADGRPGAVIAPALAERLALAPGDTVTLAGQQFRITAILTDEPDNAGAGFMLGPRTLVAIDALQDTGLFAPGTLFESAYRVRLPQGMTLDAAQALTLEQIGEGHHWRDARNGAPGIAQFVERLGGFLILVGLAGLAVGGVGVASAVRNYLDGKTETIATLKTLGADRSMIFSIYLIQIAVISALAIIIGLANGIAIPFVIVPLLGDRIPFDLSVNVHARAIIEPAIYGALTAAVFSLWPLARAQDLRGAALYRGDVAQAGWPRWPYLVAIALLVAGLCGAAVGFSTAPLLASATLGGVATFLLVLAVLGIAARKLAARLARNRTLRGRPVLRLALGAVGGPGRETVVTMLALGLGLTVLATVGQIDRNLRREIATELPKDAPSYFVVDIQSAQLAGFLADSAAAEGVERVETAPMLRGVITRINGRPAQEVAGDHWVIQGDRGLTYSRDLPGDTSLVAGTWWADDYDGPPLISFSAEEAEEIGLEIGDSLTVNILGRPVTGTIASFREVDFSSAGIGFVMSMNPSALASAPQSHIATIYATDEASGPLVRGLSRDYPNITMIRVRDAVDRVIELVSSIAAATSLGASATLVIGFVVLVSAIASGEGARRYEAAILKSIGAQRAQIMSTFALRFLLIGAIAGAAALALGSISAWLILTFVMNADYQFDLGSGLTIVLIGLVLTIGTSSWFTARSLQVRAAQVLRSPE